MIGWHVVNRGRNVVYLLQNVTIIIVEKSSEFARYGNYKFLRMGMNAANAHLTLVDRFLYVRLSASRRKKGHQGAAVFVSSLWVYALDVIEMKDLLLAQRYTCLIFVGHSCTATETISDCRQLLLMIVNSKLTVSRAIPTSLLGVDDELDLLSLESSALRPMPLEGINIARRLNKADQLNTTR
jgi:hypothetical protein